MNLKKSLFLVLTTVFALASAAQAKPLNFLVGGGASIGTGDLGDMTKNPSFHGLVGVDVSFPGPLGLVGTIGYNIFKGGVELAPGINSGDVNILEIIPAAKYSMGSVPAFKPYVLGGIGLATFSQKNDGGTYNTPAGPVTVTSTDTSETKAVIAAGIGADISKLFAEIRYHAVLVEQGDANFLTATVGLKF